MHAGRQADYVTLDIDDTLIQTQRTAREARQRTAEHFERSGALPLLRGRVLSTLEALVPYFGSGNEAEFLYALCAEGGLRGEERDRTAQEAQEVYRRDYLALLRPFPKTIATLQELSARGYLLAILSNGQEEFQRVKLACTHLESYFFTDRILISSSFGLGADKPHQAMYHHFLARCGSPPERVFSVGDKLSDIVGANLAEMQSVWILQGVSERYCRESFVPPLQVETPRYTIRGIEELLEILL